MAPDPRTAPGDPRTVRRRPRDPRQSARTTAALWRAVTVLGTAGLVFAAASFGRTPSTGLAGAALAALGLVVLAMTRRDPATAHHRVGNGVAGGLVLVGLVLLAVDLLG